MMLERSQVPQAVKMSMIMIQEEDHVPGLQEGMMVYSGSMCQFSSM